MEVRDSRRVPGLNVIWDRPGAVLDVTLESAATEAFIAAWKRAAGEAQTALSWEIALATRPIQGGLSLALGSPMDGLFTATEVNEWACAHAAAELEGSTPRELAAALPEFKREFERERGRRKGLVELLDAAAAHGVSSFSDDERTSIGMGRGSQSYSNSKLPSPDMVSWASVHDIPVALVTGTNGKSTSVRLLAAIVAEAGLVAGMSTTDWVRVGDEILEQGDFSGSSGARMVLRDARVDIGLLECARGGLSRRGLGVRRASVALITNLAEDHLGEWGVHDLAALGDVKFVVARAVEQAGVLVLNADDSELLRRGMALSTRNVAYFTRDPGQRQVLAHLQSGGAAAFLEDGGLWYARGASRERILTVDEAQFLMNGAAGHNVSNALGAICVAFALGLGAGAIRAGLRGFSSDPKANPGRLNRFELGGLIALCDFAHNPHGMRALFEMSAALSARRTLVILGQAGDRDDHSIRELARLSAEARPDRIVIKEMPEHLRGREPGVVVGMIAGELELCGFPAANVEFADNELDAVRRSLAWARDGDLLLLLLHAQREEVLSWLDRLKRAKWIPGAPLPD